MDHPIYLDSHATTPVHQQVFEAMQPYLDSEYGNAASITHSFGWTARNAVDDARSSLAGLVGAAPREIVFTSGATESDNLAIWGVAEARRSEGRHIVTCATEHKAVLDTARYLEARGYEVTYLRVDHAGRVNLADVASAIRSDTILISVMSANNEIGTLQPIREIGELARSRNVTLHTDAAQALAYGPVTVDALQVDLMSISAHKMYGPKGVGALYVRTGTPIVPMIHGGGHEGGLRSGTLNVPGIVGLGAAAGLSAESGVDEAERIRRLRETLHDLITAGIPDAHLNGHPTLRLPNNLNLSFPGVDAQLLLNRLRTVIAASTGSACTSATPEPSHVLRAIGVPHDLSFGSVRFGLGRSITSDDIEKAAAAVIREVGFLRDHARSATEPADQ